MQKQENTCMPAKPTMRPMTGEQKRAEGKTKMPQGGIEAAEPQTQIIAMCRQAESLAKLMAAGAGNDEPENTHIRDTAFERVCAIASEMAHYDAAEPEDILGKIRLWRMLAVEDALNPETSAPDERLLLSIIEDIEGQLAVQ
jgi:hypothetical protein